MGGGGDGDGSDYKNIFSTFCRNVLVVHRFNEPSHTQRLNPLALPSCGVSNPVRAFLLGADWVVKSAPLHRRNRERRGHNHRPRSIPFQMAAFNQAPVKWAQVLFLLPDGHALHRHPFLDVPFATSASRTKSMGNLCNPSALDCRRRVQRRVSTSLLPHGHRLVAVDTVSRPVPISQPCIPRPPLAHAHSAAHG